MMVNGSVGDFLKIKSRLWVPVAYIAGLILMNLLSIPLAPDGMPEDCPENSRNCERMQIMLDVSDEELHKAMEDWVDTRIFTASFSEGHIVDRTLFMQFPDDLTYENKCGLIEVQSESRIGGSDFGVNADRLDNLEKFLKSYDFETTCQ
tara:strand:+ start:313 stop:759 length:447 start_codon:yes stop_codon:yes gene_type:complete